MAFALWCLPGWIGLLSLVIDRLERSNPFGWAWQLASRGMLVGLLTPISFVFVIVVWRALSPMSLQEKLVAAFLALPTAVAVLATMALIVQTFIGTI